jgi:hypothetical protein
MHICTILDASTLDNLGKAVPTHNQKDTGSTSNIISPTILTRREYSDSVGAINRRRQRQRISEMSNESKSN